MLVSVIMPAYNAERFVQQAIRSLLLDLGPLQLDIVVVDDGSTDTTVDIVRGLAKRHHEIRLVEAPRGGVAVARNRGLDALPDEAQLVTFHDSDDVAYPGRIARQTALLQSVPGAQAVYGLLQFVDLIDDDTLLPSCNARTMTMRTVQLSCGLYRREILHEIGRFDESLIQSEDTDFLLRLIESGAHVVMEEEVSTFYRRHEANMTCDTAIAQREFVKAIHKSLKRRRSKADGKVTTFASGLFSDRTKFEELFEACPASTQP